MRSDEYPCPCPACDSVTLMQGELCAKCMHNDCTGEAPKCPAATQSSNWCDYCHSKKETVPARPEAEENHICGDCHPSGSLPNRDNWWEPVTCNECGEENPFTESASCSNCGYIPEDKRA